jgi:serine/threonine protein kinase
MSKKELFAISLFIETKMKRHLEKGRYYIKKERSKVARTIEHDPKTKRTFIHLKGHGVPKLGQGWHKKVTLSIMYDLQSPELVANCVCTDNSCNKEISILKKLKNKKGIVNTYAITQHKKRKGRQKVTSMIVKLYNGHSLHHYQLHPEELTKKQQIIVARDLLCGLEQLHKHDLIHRDMHAGNFLIDKSKDPETGKMNVSAAIIDLGQAKKNSKTKREAPMVQVPRRLNPPDAFNKMKHSIRTKTADIYALGCNLFHMYYHSQPQWSRKSRFLKIKHLSNKKRHLFKHNLAHRIHKHIKNRKARLEEKRSKGINTKYDKFAQVILKMCHPKPYKRGTAHELRERLDRILAQLD